MAVAENLQSRGHEIACGFPEQFSESVGQMNLPFFGLSRKFLDLIESEDGRIVMGGKASLFRRVSAFFRLARKGFSLNSLMAEEQERIIAEYQPDLIIHHPKAIFPVLYALQHPGKAVMLVPVPCMLHPVPGYPNVGMYKYWLGQAFPGLSYAIARWGLIQNLVKSTKGYIQQHRISRHTIAAQLDRHPALYCISPAVFPEPESWLVHARMVGFQERNQQQHFNPAPALSTFLDHHPKVMLLSFGSMSNPDPERITGLFLRAMEKLNIPCIINAAWGGLQEPEDYNNDLFHFVKGIPYDWAFPRVYAVIHHGGAGTTQTALKHGCAAMIIPHIIDQFLWNDINHQLGTGPRGQGVRDLSSKQLEKDMYSLWTTPSYKERATQVATQMKAETPEEDFYRLLKELSATQARA